MDKTDSTQIGKAGAPGDGNGTTTAIPENAQEKPDAEVEAKAKRRQFSASYKARILEEIDRSPGETGAIVRREGLYWSHVTTWRKQRREGTLRALAPNKRGRKPKSAAEIENEQLRKRMAKMERELEKAQLIIAAQKKLATILATDLPKIVECDDESE